MHWFYPIRKASDKIR